MQTGEEEEASKSSGPQNQWRKKKATIKNRMKLETWISQDDCKTRNQLFLCSPIYQLSSLIDEEKSTQFVLFYKEEPQDCKRIFLQARWWHMGLTNLFTSCWA
jgi:hypothetical protein